MRVFKSIEQWASDRNLIEGSSPQAQFVKLAEEFGELAEGIAKGRNALVLDSIGDMIVVLTVIAKQYNTSIEECSNLAYAEIKDRKGRMIDGIFIKESDY